MKAIVLTYDQNQPFREHMIACYRDHWPDHPFTFHIPVNASSTASPEPCCTYIRTDPAIRATVLTLLQDLDEEEWIFWCIDDKYPVRLELPRIQRLYESILVGEMEGCDGVLFCRARRMLDPDCLLPHRRSLGGESLIERRAYHQIWIHQFVRVKVIRHLFHQFPEEIARASDMDKLKNRLTKPAHHHLFVTAENLAIFGESTVDGRVTTDCYQSLLQRGFEITERIGHQPVPGAIIGKLEQAL